MTTNIANQKSTLHHQWVPASAMGEHLASLRPCLGTSVETLQKADQLRIPALNPAHYFARETYQVLAAWHELAGHEPLYISGPSGSGKTSSALQFCARLNVPVVCVTARARMDRRELIGHYALVGGETVWIDGPATLAWRHGWTLIINEFSAAPADMWVSCNDILEGAPIDVDATGEVIPPHPETRVIVTDNTRGHSSEIDEGFYGRQVQDRSVIDRFWHLRMEGLGEKEEAELLKATAPDALTEGFDPLVLDRLWKGLAKLGADSRSASMKEEVGFQTHAVPVSHRVLQRLRNLVLDAARQPMNQEADITRRLMKTALSEALEAAAREAAETLAFNCLGTLVHDLRLSRARMVMAMASGKTA